MNDLCRWNMTLPGPPALKCTCIDHSQASVVQTLVNAGVIDQNAGHGDHPVAMNKEQNMRGALIESISWNSGARARYSAYAGRCTGR